MRDGVRLAGPFHKEKINLYCAGLSNLHNAYIDCTLLPFKCISFKVALENMQKKMSHKFSPDFNY